MKPTQLRDPTHRTRTSHTWQDAVRLGHRLNNSEPSTATLLEMAPLLVDSRWHEHIDPVLDHAAKGRSLSAGSLYALGRRAAVRGDSDSARAWLTRAEATCKIDTPDSLRSRIAFELGCLHLQAGGIDAAETVASNVQSHMADPSGEVLHLRALIAEFRGERGTAISIYRAAIAAATGELTPMTKVLAARNFAVAWCHESPSEACELYLRALELLKASDLDPRLEPTLRNGFGYSLICSARLADAEAQLRLAHDLATTMDRPVICAHSLFNQSIVAELRDDLRAASAAVEASCQLARVLDLSDLVAWCAIRRTWLELKSGTYGIAKESWQQARVLSRDVHVQALATLEAFFALIDGNERSSALLFGELASRYREQSDVLTAFALLRWQAFSARRAGLSRAAVIADGQANDLGRRHVIRLSPNWWAREIADSAEIAPPTAAGDQVLTVRTGVLYERDRLVLVRGALIAIDGIEVPEVRWQCRSGAHVLKRVFATLSEAYPRGIQRDELTDLLWPNSDGDRARGNLYGATKDLRRFLALVPGLRLTKAGSSYRLEAQPNVRWERGHVLASSVEGGN